MAFALNFKAFRKQFESILAKLKAEVENGNEDQIVIKQTIGELIKHHTFIKE